MFNGLGIQWAGTLLGCFAVLLIPIPVCFLLYGRKLREKSKFAPTMKRKPQQEEPQEDTSDDDDASKHEFPALAASRSRAHVDESTTLRQRTRADEANRDIEAQKTNGEVNAEKKAE